jgi:hypothetical protein
MIQFVNEPVAVEVRRRRDGGTIPIAFVWRGRRHLIASWGRERAKAQDGQSVRCHLVQTANQETWEICQDTETAQWTLSRHWAARHLVL